jgi:zinc protease
VSAARRRAADGGAPLPADSIHRSTLPNGLTLLLREDRAAPVVSIVTYVKAGYFDESDDVVGIAHVLEHMFFKGTPTRGVGVIAQQTKAAGGYLNAGTIYDHTGYYTVLPAARLERGLDIQGDAYANSLLDGDELARELEVIIQEANRKADNPGAVSVETTYELLFDRHRMRRWRIGRERELRTLGRQQVREFYRQFYRPSNTILSIVGDVDAERTAQLVASGWYGQVPDAPIVRDRGPAEADWREFRYRELSGDVTQTQLVFGWRTPDAMHPDTPLLELAGIVLGQGRASRLYRAVRDRRLAAAVSAHDYVPTDLGVFTIHGEGPPERTIEAAQAIWSELRTLREDGITEDEMERARSLVEARWIRRLETMDGQANYLAEWQALGDWRLGDRHRERLLTATASEVRDAVRRWLAPDRAAVLTYRPSRSAVLATDAAAMRSLLESGASEPLPSSAPRAWAPVASGRRLTAEHQEGDVRVYRAEGGAPILARHKPGAPLVHLGVYFTGGAIEEQSALAGLSILMARTSIKGTAQRSATQVAEDAELLGGSVSPSVSSESFGWTISVPASRAEAALELLSDVVLAPIFPSDALEVERSIALADLALLRDDMYRYPLRLLTQAAYAGHPYGVPVSGSEETLGRVTVDQVRAWHALHIGRSAATVALVGDLDRIGDEVVAAAAQRFASLVRGELPNTPGPVWPAASVLVAEQREKAQTALTLAFPSPSRMDDDRYAARLIAGVASGLGGRFFEELRDRQSLGYTVSAFPSERRLAGLFVAYIATSPAKEEVARAGLLREFAKLREAPVSDEELSRAQEYAVGTHAIRQQSGGAVLGDLVDVWMNGGNLAELAEHDERTRRVTALQMRGVAEKYFDESRVVEAVVRGEELGSRSQPLRIDR